MMRTLRHILPAAGIRLLALTAVIGLAGLRCSSSDAPTAGGGSDLPNGAVASLSGGIRLPDSTAASDVAAYLRRIVVTESGESLLVEFTTLTDTQGVFTFDSIPGGKYVLYCESGDRFLSFVNQDVILVEDSVVHAGSLVLGPRSDLDGYVVLPAGNGDQILKIFIPGTQCKTTVHANTRQVHYVLNGVPSGSFDVAFVCADVVNYLPVQVHPDSAGTTVHVRDVVFAPLGVMADTALSPHQCTVKRSLYVSPADYPAGMEPSWYSAMEFGNVDYFRYDSAGLVAWAGNDTSAPALYDTVLVGVVARDDGGRVVLETFDGRRRELTGDEVRWIGSHPVFVIAAVNRKEFNGRVWYEVVEIDTYSPGPT